MNKKFMDSQSVEQFLELVRFQMNRTLERHSTDLLQHMVLDFLRYPGKMLRPTVAYKLGTIFQVPSPAVVCWSATCEILHNATLVHDDLQDGDVARRGRPTVWLTYGAAQAINLGDLLLLAAPLTLFEAKLSEDTTTKLTRAYAQMGSEIVNGQSFEPLLLQITEPSELLPNYHRCIQQKTAALFAGLARGVGIIAELSANEIESLSGLFLQLGIIFQLQDDILDLYGEKQRDGRGCDIKEGKVSCLVATHVQKHPQDFPRLMKVLKTPRESTTEFEVEELIQLFENQGTLEACLKDLDTRIRLALSHPGNLLHEALPDLTRGILDQFLENIKHLIKMPKS